MFPRLPDPLWPAKLKNGHFWLFLDFSTIKKFANGKIEDIHFKAQTTSFNLIPKLCGLDRAPLSYDPITEPGSEKIFFKQMYVVRSKNDESKK